MYTGSYPSAAVRWALSVTSPDSLVILSAKHGLIPARTVIEPYNMTITDPAAVTADQLHEQASALGLLDGLVITLAPIPYVKRLHAAGVDAYDPFLELVRQLNPGVVPKFGYQVQQMNRHRGRYPELNKEGVA